MTWLMLGATNLVVALNLTPVETQPQTFGNMGPYQSSTSQTHTVKIGALPCEPHT